MILPFDTATFRRQSVVDRPGDWGPLFDRIVSEIERAGDLILLGLSGPNKSAYEETNRAILSEGEALSARMDARARVAVIVWDGKPRGPDDLAHQFREEAVGRGWETREVSTLLLPSRLPADAQSLLLEPVVNGPTRPGGGSLGEGLRL